MDILTSALTRIAQRAATARRDELSGYVDTLSSIRSALDAIRLSLSPEGMEQTVFDFDQANIAVDWRLSTWKARIAQANQMIDPDLNLCPALSRKDLASHIRAGENEIASQHRDYGNPLVLTVNGRRIGEIDPYDVHISGDFLEIGRDEGKMRIPLSDIHAVTAVERLVVLVGSLLGHPSEEGYVAPYLVRIDPDLSWRNP